MNNERIPFVYLKKHHQDMQKKINVAINRVITESCFILGKPLEEFEQAFAKFCGSKYGIGVSSGTEALHLTLRAMEIGKGDEVITVANTFTSTALAIMHAGATVRLVDADQKTFNIDSEKLRNAITKKTKAIIPVHLYGQPAEMDKINAIAKQYSLLVLEDACQAHGARYGKKRVGSLGTAAAFSFYPSKNLGGMGDGGLVTTNDETIAKKIRIMRHLGQETKNCSSVMGFNSRLDTLQAAILKIKLQYLDANNALRRQNAAHYRKVLVDTSLIVPKEREGDEPVYHLFVVQTPQRDALAAYLKERNIETGIHYPLPLHLQPVFKHLGYQEGDFPVSEKLSKEILSLPMFPELTKEQIERIADAIHLFEKRM